jgi:hypothetical protein
MNRPSACSQQRGQISPQFLKPCFRAEVLQSERSALGPQPRHAVCDRYRRNLPFRLPTKPRQACSSTRSGAVTFGAAVGQSQRHTRIHTSQWRGLRISARQRPCPQSRLAGRVLLAATDLRIEAIQPPPHGSCASLSLRSTARPPSSSCARDEPPTALALLAVRCKPARQADPRRPGIAAFAGA